MTEVPDANGELPPFDTLVDNSAPESGPGSRPQKQLAAGSEVGRYVVLARIGAGGMGVVYSAYDPELDRKVALKLLHPGDGAGERPSLGHARLAREAKAMAKLTHPNVATVHDVGSFGSRVFIAMEYVGGGTLRQWLVDAHPWREVVDLFVAAGRGLAAAHAEGIVHRDFKPDNVLVGIDGRARVVDFGLARQIPKTDVAAEEESEGSEPSRSGIGRVTDKLTLTGSLAGTPAYMAPEQHRSLTADARTDQFSFAVALWEALYGSRPFAGDTRRAIAQSVCGGKLESAPTTSKVPVRIQRALAKALQVEPSNRFANMNALLGQLERENSGSRGRVFAAAVAVTLSVTMAAVTLWPDPDMCGAGAVRMGETWNAHSGDGIRESFAATEAVFSSTAADMAVAQLEAYATEWVAAHRESCEATHVHREQSERALDLRQRCLSRGLDALHGTVRTLSAADDAAVRNAARAISRLPRPTECADVTELSLVAPPPADASVADAVESTRRRATELLAQATLGGFKEAFAEAERLHEEAGTIEYPPLWAETGLLVGKVAQMAGNSERAEGALRGAVLDAVTADHDRLLAEAVISLVIVVGIALSRHDDAVELGRYATAAVKRLGDDSVEKGQLANAMCKMLADKSDTVAALPHCHRTVELTTARFGEGHLATAEAHQALGTALYYAASVEAARDEWMLARDTFFEVKGADHPDHAQMQNNLAAVCLDLEPAETCVAEFGKAVELGVAGFGPDHPSVADWRNNYAVVLMTTGQHRQAQVQARESMRIRRASGKEHPSLGASLAVLGRAAAAEGELEEAERMLSEALAVTERTRGAGHRDLARSHRQLAEVLVMREAFARARTHYEAALAVTLGLEATEGEAAALRATLDSLPPG